MVPRGVREVARILVFTYVKRDSPGGTGRALCVEPSDCGGLHSRGKRRCSAAAQKLSRENDRLQVQRRFRSRGSAPGSGNFRKYADVSEINGPSDIGGALAPCGEGFSKCIEFSGRYFVVPPPGENEWFFGGDDFRLVSDPSGRERHTVVVSRYGDEHYSYGFSPRCGVEWINFSLGWERGEEVFYPVGRSLFSESVCTPTPTD